MQKIKEDNFLTDEKHRIIKILAECTNSKSEIVCKLSSNELTNLFYKDDGAYQINNYIDKIEEIDVAIIKRLLSTTDRNLRINFMSALTKSENIDVQEFVIKKLFNEKGVLQVEIAILILSAISNKPHLKQIINRLNINNLINSKKIDNKNFIKFVWFDKKLLNFQVVYSYILNLIKKVTRSPKFLDYFNSTIVRRFFLNFNKLQNELIISFFLYFSTYLERGRLYQNIDKLAKPSSEKTRKHLKNEGFHIVELKNSKDKNIYEYNIILLDFNRFFIRNLMHYKYNKLYKFWINAMEGKDNNDRIIKLEEIGKKIRNFFICIFILLSFFYLNTITDLLFSITKGINRFCVFVFALPEKSAKDFVYIIKEYFINYSEKNTQNIIDTMNFWFTILLSIILTLALYMFIKRILIIIRFVYNNELHNAIYFFLIIVISSSLIWKNISEISGVLYFGLTMILNVLSSNNNVSIRIAKVNPISQMLFTSKKTVNLGFVFKFRGVQGRPS